MTALARITVDTPHRRLDLVAPSGVPVADLLHALVEAGGERLADSAAASGWVIRQADGAPLSAARTLHEQGVRDGALLCLVPADETWPALEFDAIDEAVAATRRADRPWSPLTTRMVGIAIGWLTSLAALAALIRSPNAAVPVSGALAAVLIGAAVVLARTREDPAAGTLLAGLALPYVFAAALLLDGSSPHPPGVIRAGVTTAAVTAIISAGIGRIGAIAMTFGSASLLGAVAAAGLRFASPSAVAACAFAAVVIGAGSVPAVAVRLSRLDSGSAASLNAVAAGVARADTIVTGLSGGVAFVAACASGVLVGSGWGRALVIAGVAVLAGRSRAYDSTGPRLAAMAGTLAAAVPLAAWAIRTGSAPVELIASAALSCGFAVLAGTPHLARLPFRRIAEPIETLALLAILPFFCGVLDLYAKAAALR